MAARVFGIRQEGVSPCRMVPSMKGRGTRQLHDVTGKVQSAAVNCRAKCVNCELPRWNCAKFKKKENELIWRTKASLAFG